MPETMKMYYHDLYEMNLTMLMMTREERWDDFVDMASRYVIKKQDALTYATDSLSLTAKESLKIILKQLIENETEIARNLQTRLSSLKQNLSSIHRGTQYSQLYTAHQSSSLH